MPGPPHLDPPPRPEGSAASDPNSKDGKPGREMKGGSSPGKPGDGRGPGPGGDGKGWRPSLDKMPPWLREKIDKMPREEKERFIENLSRWRELDEKEREEIRERFREEKNRMRKTAQDALKAAGITLDADRLEVFELRYAQERRRIEEMLKSEMEKRRTDELQKALDRLKTEFAPFALPSSEMPPSKSKEQLTSP